MLQEILNNRCNNNKIHKTSLIHTIESSLEQLLNTRKSSFFEASSNTVLEKTLFNYGLPELVYFNCQSTKDREILRKIIEETIENYETRLHNVKVYILENTETNPVKMLISITAVLKDSHQNNTIQCLSEFNPLSQVFSFKGDAA